jgi:hypothetical protein
MGLLDRLPGEGRRGVLVALATGVVTLLVSGLLAWHTWGGDGDAPAPAAAPTRADDGLVRVVSRKGGFALAVPRQMTGEQLGRNIRVARPDGSLVITVGPGPRGGLEAAQRAAVAGVEAGYPDVSVSRRTDVRLSGAPALRTVGSLRRGDGTELVFSVTSTTRGQRSWSVVMFAGRDVTARDLRRWYQPVLDGFTVLA